MTDWLRRAYAAARGEGQVVWYTGLLLDEVALPICRAFERRYPGVEAICDRSWPVDAVGKAIAERGRDIHRCDVFDGVGSPALARAAGLATDAALPELAAIPPQWRGASGQWAAQILYHATHAWNTDLVAAEDAPQGFEDLLDPRWKGRMCWSRATLSGRPGFVALAEATMGPQGARDYLRLLAAQEIASLDGLGRDTMRALGLRRHAIALQVFAHHALIERKAGGKVAWAQGSPTLTFANPLGILRGAPHPLAARLFVNFVLSVEGQQVMREGFHVPARPDVAPLDPGLAGLHGQVLDPFAVAEGLPRWEALGAEMFGD